jgi:hypothetical protein
MGYRPPGGWVGAGEAGWRGTVVWQRLDRQGGGAAQLFRYGGGGGGKVEEVSLSRQGSGVAVFVVFLVEIDVAGPQLAHS